MQRRFWIHFTLIVPTSNILGPPFGPEFPILGPQLRQNSLFWGPSCARKPYSGKSSNFSAESNKQALLRLRKPYFGTRKPYSGGAKRPPKVGFNFPDFGASFWQERGIFLFFYFLFSREKFSSLRSIFFYKKSVKKFCVSARGKVAFPLGEKVSNFSWQKFQLSFLGISWNFSWQKSQLFCGIKQTGPFAARKPYFGIPKNANAWEVQLARFLWPVGGRRNKRNQTKSEIIHQ